MMSQQLTQVRPEADPGVITPARIGGIAPRNSGVVTIVPRSSATYGERTMTVSVWRQGTLRAPFPLRAPFRQRVANWRARNWRRAVLAWSVVTLALMVTAAEPSTDFPKAQAASVPAVRVVLRVTEVLTLTGVPALLIALP